jgi:hypothetical protein
MSALAALRRAAARTGDAAINRVGISMLGGLLGAPAGIAYGAFTDRDEMDNREFGDAALGGALVGASLPHVSQRFARELIEGLNSKDARFQARVMSDVMRAARARGDAHVPHADGYGWRDYAEHEGGGGFGQWLNERSDGLIEDYTNDQREFDAMARAAGMEPPRMRDLIDEARAGSYLDRSTKRLGDWSVGGNAEGAPLLAVPAALGVMGALDSAKKRKRA